MNTIDNNIQPLEMSDLFNHRIKTGFFSAPATSDSISLLLEKMVDVFDEEQRTSISSLKASRASRIGQLFWIDSAHSFDPGFVAQRSAIRGMNPQRVLRSIHVNQIYTQTQLYQAVRSVPRTQIWLSYQHVSSLHHPLPSLCEGGGRPASVSRERKSVLNQGKSAHIQYRPLVVVSDLFGLFLNAAVEGRREVLLQEFLWQVSLLAKSAIVVGLVSEKNIESQSSLRSFLHHYTQPLSITHSATAESIAASA